MPTNDNCRAVGFKIILNGKEIDSFLTQSVESIMFVDEINCPSMFVIKFNLIHYQKTAMIGVDLELFQLGDVIELKMGTDKINTLLIGMITSLSPNFSPQSTFEIKGYDRLYLLRLGRHRRSFTNIKDNELVEKIASESGLIAETDNTEIMYDYLFQNNQTNYEFLFSRVQRINYELYVQDKKLFFTLPREKDKPSLTLRYGFELERFEGQVNTLTEGSSTEVRGWDNQTKKVLSQEYSTTNISAINVKDIDGFTMSQAFGATPTALIENHLQNAKEAEILAKSEYQKSLQKFFLGYGECIGMSTLLSGKVVKLTGLSNRFDRDYYVYSTTHTYSVGQGYNTRFNVRRAAI